MKHPRLAAALVAGASLPALAACTSNSSTDGTDATAASRTISVTSSDDACDLSADSAPSGTLTYRVKNTGSKVTEFYLYAEDGQRIVGEVENVGPGITRELVVRLDAGTYIPACKPGMTGKGIRSTFTVTKSKSKSNAAGGSASDAVDTQLDTANEQYHEYVEDQAAALLSGTRRFVAAYRAGDDAQARKLYPRTRIHWERIEPVAESFGDLDPQMDLREADLEPGQRWTGWHRLEKDLWPPKTGYTRLTEAQRASYGRDLLAHTRTLNDRVAKLSFTADQVANGAKSLLDEVATGKVTGEEEVWSHTDLYDFAANIDGAHVAFEGLEPVLVQRDHELAELIDRRFADVQRLLDRHRTGGGFVGYDTLSRTEVRQLSDAVNALSEPLSKLTAAVTL